MQRLSRGEHEYEPISPGPVLVIGPETKREPNSDEQANLPAAEMQRRLEDTYLASSGGSAGATATAGAAKEAAGAASTENQENEPPGNTSLPEVKVQSPEEVDAEDEKAATDAKHAEGLKPRMIRASHRGMQHIRSGADKIKTKFRSISLPPRPTVSLPRSLQRARQSKSGERKGPLRVGQPTAAGDGDKEPTATSKFIENIRTYPRMLEKRFARSTSKKGDQADQDEPMDTSPPAEGTETETQATKKTLDFDFRTYPRMIGKRIQRMTSRQDNSEPQEDDQTEPKTTKRKFDFSTYPRAIERRIRQGISRQPPQEPDISAPIQAESVQPKGTSTPTETPVATLTQQAAPPTEGEPKTTKKKFEFDFDFRTYPRLFDRKRQRNAPDTDMTSASPEVVEVASPGQPLASPTQVSDFPTKGKRFLDFDFKTYPRLIQKKIRRSYATSSPKAAKRGPALPPRRKGPVGSRWVNRFDDIRYADDEEIECASGGTESSAAFHDKDYGYAVTLPPRPTDERYGREGSEDDEGWGHRGSQSGGSAADADAESSDGSRRRGVLEEIDSDEFFLRQKGISQEDLHGGNSLNTQIRDALSDLGQQYRATPERIVPPARPSRPSRKSTDEPVVFGTFPPVRPKRDKKEPHSIPPQYDEVNAEIETETGEGQGPPLPPKRDKRGVKRRDFSTLQAGERRWSLGYEDEESWMKDIESQILPADSPLLAVSRAEPRYIVPGDAVPVGDTPPVPPKRGRRSKQLDYDEDEPGYAHIPRREEEEELQRDGEVMVNGDIGGHEYVDEPEDGERPQPPQRVKPPRPPPPAIRTRRRRRTAEDGIVSKETNRKTPFSYFFSMPRKTPRTYYIVTPPTRPRRNYSTVRPLRPPRNSRAKPRHHSTSALDMLGTNGSLQDANGSSRDLQSDDVIEKMKGRPLPAPPRPPRKTREDYEMEAVEDVPIKAQIAQEALAGAGASSLPLGGIEKLVTQLDAALGVEPAAGAFSDEIFYRQRDSQEFLPQADDGGTSIPILLGPTPPRVVSPTLPTQATAAEEKLPPRKISLPEPAQEVPIAPSPPRKTTPPKPTPLIAEEPTVPRKITPPKPTEVIDLKETEPGVLRREQTRQLDPSSIELEESERAPELPKRSPPPPKTIEPEVDLITEVSIATQTDPLPDDVCVEDEGELIIADEGIILRPPTPLLVSPSPLPQAPPPTPYSEPESRPPLQQPIFTLPEPLAALMSLSSSSEIQAPRLRLADLDVDRLNVGELKAHKISVSEIEGMCLHVSELSSQGGQLVVSSLSSLTPISAPQPVQAPVQQSSVIDITSIPSTSSAQQFSPSSSSEVQRPSSSAEASSLSSHLHHPASSTVSGGPVQDSGVSSTNSASASSIPQNSLPLNAGPSVDQSHSSSEGQLPRPSSSAMTKTEDQTPSLSNVESISKSSSHESPILSSSQAQHKELSSPEPISRDQTASPEESTLRPSSAESLPGSQVITSSLESVTLQQRTDTIGSDLDLQQVSPSLSTLSISESLGSSPSLASSDDLRHSSIPAPSQVLQENTPKSTDNLQGTSTAPVPRIPEPIPAAHKITRKATPPPDESSVLHSARDTIVHEAATSSSVGSRSSSENVAAPRGSEAHPASSGKPLEEASITELGQQLVRASGAATIRAVRALLESALGRVRPGDPQPHPGELQLAMVLLLVIVAGLLLLSGGSTTHHHWDFYFPP